MTNVNPYERNLAIARELLQYVPATIHHDERTLFGMGLRSAGVVFDEWDTWLQQNPRYDKAESKSMWISFKAGKTGLGTSINIAKKYGYKITHEQKGKHSKPVQPPAKPPQKPVQPPQPLPGTNALPVWERCLPALITHEYAVRKQISSATIALLRVVPPGDNLFFSGTRLEGYLAVPMYAPDGTLQTLQLIPPGKGEKKLNLPGATMKGATLRLGNSMDTPLCFTESIGNADSIHVSTGYQAVCCFGSGNIKTAVADYRSREPGRDFIIVPDRGKENEAWQIAAEYQCRVAVLPEDRDDKSDINDLYCDTDFDVVATLIESATKPPEPEPHPLARYLDIDCIVKPPRWVIPGFIEEGVVGIAGSMGVGKTTALLPLAMTSAGLHGYELMPVEWRHVIYVTEDSRQAKRIISGIVNHGGLGIDINKVRERIHLVDAVRLDAPNIASIGKTYREQFKRVVNDVEILPLVILDTKSAIIQMDNENDNAEAARIMCSLKQDFASLPVWIIGHVSKDNMKRTDVATSRGAGAIDADANQTLFVIKEENGKRYLIQGKERCSPRWSELEIESHMATVAAQDVFGNFENVTLRWGTATPQAMSRKEAAKQAVEDAQQADEGELRQSIRDAVELAWNAGNPLNRASLFASIKRKQQTVRDALENLLAERWMYEVHVPAKERIHPKKSLYLVNFSTVEHEAILAGKGLPDVKLVVPESWRKPPISINPEKTAECSKDDSVLEGGAA